MAKTSATSSYTNIIADIRKRKFAPIYILSGQEPFFIDQITDLLQALVVPEDMRDFDYTVMFGPDTEIEQAIGAARQFPMMAQKTLVMLREAQGMRDAKSEVAKLEAYFAHPTDTTVFVLTWKGDPFKSTNALVKAALKNGGVIFESQKPKDWQLDTLISDYCSSKQISIDHKSVELLKDSIGNDLKRLYSEIDKLLIATSGAPITPEVIERNIGISRDFNNFELTRALSVRDYNKAMQIVNYFERNPKQNPAIVTAALLFTFFSNLMLAHYAPDKSDKGLMTQLKFHTSYQLTDVKPALKRYSALSCMRIIHAIRDYDRKSKGVGSLQKEFPLLKELIYKIFTL